MGNYDISAKTHKCYTSNHLFENRGIKVFFFLSKEKKYDWDFSGGMADKNPPANAGDTGLILGPGRFHISHTTKAQGDTTTELTL